MDICLSDTIKKNNIHIIKIDKIQFELKFELIEINKIGNKGLTHTIILNIGDNYDILYQIDKKLIILGKDNKDKWPFSDRNNIRYRQSIRYLDRKPILKLNCQKTKTFQTVIDNLIYEDNKSEDNKNMVNCDIELYGIWISDNNYGAYYKLHSITSLQ